eukprot:Sspe_Gene.20259::Locus_7431_Transcript_1_1_Confidence_1.000_Length_1920::g.20259::m.20259
MVCGGQKDRDKRVAEVSQSQGRSWVGQQQHNSADSPDTSADYTKAGSGRGREGRNPDRVHNPSMVEPPSISDGLHREHLLFFFVFVLGGFSSLGRLLGIRFG